MMPPITSPNPFQPHTALILVDPFNDFLHPTGKLYPRVETSIKHNDAVANIERLVAFAHDPKTRIPIFYALHQPHTPHNYAGWQHKTVMHSTAESISLFDAETANGSGPAGGLVLSSLLPDIAGGDVIASRHWTHSSFNNTDLDALLRQHDIQHLVLAGMETSTCLETTVRYGYELGYQVTVVNDATAGFSVESWAASVDGTWPLLPIKAVRAADLIDGWNKAAAGLCERKKAECSEKCQLEHAL